MKMSEFTTKSFLGNAGAAENSYILINYEDSTTTRPVTYKASLQEIGKAIANDQKLYKQTSNGPATTDVSQGAYVNSAEPLVKFNPHYNSLVTGNQTILPNVVMVESVHNTVGYFNSTSSESWTKVNTFEPGESVELPIANSQNTQEGKVVLHGGMGLFFDGTDSGRAQVVPIVTYDTTEEKLGYYDSLNGEMQYVDAGGADAAGFTNDGDIPVYVGASDGDLKWYNWADPADCTPYAVIKTNGNYLVTYDESEGTFGYFADPSDTYITPLSLGDQTDLHGYVQAASSLPGQYRLQFVEEGENGPTEVTPEMIGAASTGDITTAISGLASTGYVTAAVANAGGGFDPTAAVTCEVYPDPDNSNPQSWSLYPVMVAPSTDEIFTYDRGEEGYFPRAFVSNGFMTNAITTATNGLASTGYVDTALNNVLYYTTDVSSNISLEDGSGNTLILFRYNQADGTYTPEVPHN